MRKMEKHGTRVLVSDLSHFPLIPYVINVLFHKSSTEGLYFLSFPFQVMQRNFGVLLGTWDPIPAELCIHILFNVLPL